MPDLSPTVISWITAEAFLKSGAAARMSPILRMLLTSDGTITTALRSFRLAPVTVEVVRQETVPLDTETARFLEVEAGIPALARKARLASGGETLLSAESSILLDGLPPGLRQALLQSQQSLGLLLAESGLPVLRDRLQIAPIMDPAGLESPQRITHEPVWARRYRIRLAEKQTAAVQELFLGPFHDPRRNAP